MDNIQLRERANGRSDDEKWQPVTWKPEYEIILSLHAQGQTNIAIAELTNYTPMQISNILTCEHARLRKTDIVNNIRNNTMERIDKMTEIATKRMEEVLNNDDLAIASPFAMFDRATAYLKGVNKLASDGNNINNSTNNTVIIGDEAIKTMVDGLEKSNIAADLHKNLSGASIN